MPLQALEQSIGNVRSPHVHEPVASAQVPPVGAMHSQVTRRSFVEHV